MNPFFPLPPNQINPQPAPPNPQFPRVPPPQFPQVPFNTNLQFPAGSGVLPAPFLAPNLIPNPQLAALQSLVLNQQVLALMQQGGASWAPNNPVLALMQQQQQFSVGSCALGFAGSLQTGNPTQMMGLPVASNSTESPNSGMGMHIVQVHQLKDGETDSSNGNSENSTNNNAFKNLHSFGATETSQMRFQKPQSHHAINASGSLRPFAKNVGRGRQNWRQQNSQFNRGGKQAPVQCKRPLIVNYTEKEIKEWREARKKNFPTSSNIKKKLAGSGKILETDADATLRHQQLKEILAQQAKLGIEVAEIPPGYFSRHESHATETKSGSKYGKNGRKEWNRTNRFKCSRHSQDRRHPKRTKLANEESINPIYKKEPSLLQKLLSKEIKGDKSKLLQVFRFMIMNCFFDNWPDKPLEFPDIMIKGDVTQIDIAQDTNAFIKALDNAHASLHKRYETVDEIESLNDVVVAEDEAETEASSGDDVDGVDHSRHEDDNNEDHVERLEEGEITE